MLKTTAAKCLQAGMRFLPKAVFPSLARMMPPLQVGIPPGLEFRIDHYLRDITVEVDTTYGIERAMLSGRYDPQTLSIIQDWVRPGDTCLDVGANIGAIAFALSKQSGDQGMVYAFEPGSLTYPRFLRNLSLNPTYQNRLVPLCLGLSDQDSTLYWNEHENHRGNANLTALPQKGSIAVEVTTVDHWAERIALSRLDFVKIDVESMEYEVIRGGLETWRRHMPILYYETLSAFEKFRGKPVFEMIEQMLMPMGYTFFKVGNRGGIKKTFYPDLSANTLAIPPSRLPR